MINLFFVLMSCFCPAEQLRRLQNRYQNIKKLKMRAATSRQLLDEMMTLHIKYATLMMSDEFVSSKLSCLFKLLLLMQLCNHYN